MAIESCPRCGRQISDQAPVCLNCNTPNPSFQAKKTETIRANRTSISSKTTLLVAISVTAVVFIAILVIVFILGIYLTVQDERDISNAHATWDKGDHDQAVELYKKILRDKTIYIQKSEKENILKRVIQSDNERGKIVSAQEFIEMGIREGMKLDGLDPASEALIEQVKKNYSAETKAVEEDTAPPQTKEYYMEPPTDYPAGSAERVLLNYLANWKTADWRKMSEFTQITWRENSKDPIKELNSKYSHLNLLGYRIFGKRVVSEVCLDVLVSISTRFGERIDEDYHLARLIKEAGPQDTSPTGEWGVNPISFRKIASVEKDQIMPFTIMEIETQMKGGDPGRGLSPCYSHLVARVVIPGTEADYTEANVKPTLATISRVLQGAYSPDAIIIFASDDPKEIAWCNLAVYEWIPKGQELSRSNDRNIQRKDKYINTFRIYDTDYRKR